MAVGRALEELEIPKAAERKGRPGQERSGKLPGGSTKIGHGDVRDLVGAAVGMSGHIYHRAKTVVEAAEDETLSPEAKEVAHFYLRRSQEKA